MKAMTCMQLPAILMAFEWSVAYLYRLLGFKVGRQRDQSGTGHSRWNIRWSRVSISTIRDPTESTGSHTLKIKQSLVAWGSKYTYSTMGINGIPEQDCHDCHVIFSWTSIMLIHVGDQPVKQSAGMSKLCMVKLMRWGPQSDRYKNNGRALTILCLPQTVCAWRIMTFHWSKVMHKMFPLKRLERSLCKFASLLLPYLTAYWEGPSCLPCSRAGGETWAAVEGETYPGRTDEGRMPLSAGNRPKHRTMDSRIANRLCQTLRIHVCVWKWGIRQYIQYIIIYVYYYV